MRHDAPTAGFRLTPARLSALFLFLLVSCAMPVKRTTAAPPPPAAVQATSAKGPAPNKVSYRAPGLGRRIGGPLAETLAALTVLDRQAYNRKGGLRQSQEWWESRPHPLVASYLPGVRVFSMRYSTLSRTGRRFGRQVVLYYQGRLISTNQMNRILGSTAAANDITDMPRLARIAVMLWALQRQYQQTPAADSLSAKPMKPSGFPAITFLSERVEVWQDTTRPIYDRGPSWDAVAANCIIDGKRSTVAVLFEKPDKWGRRQVRQATAEGFSLSFQTLILPAPAPTRRPDGSLGILVASQAVTDSFPDAVSYPATQVTALRDTALAASFYDLSGGQHLSPEDSLLYRRGNAESQWWGESDAQVLLAARLPGTRVFREWYHILGYEHGSQRDWAYSGGKLYRPGSLNRLLLDGGVSLDSTEMPANAKIAVLFAAFGKTFDASGQLQYGVRPYGDTPGAGFPAITFLSTRRGEWTPPHLTGASNVRRGLFVDCIVDGVRTPMFVGFTGNRQPQPDEVFTLSDRFLIRFGYAWPDHD